MLEELPAVQLDPSGVGAKYLCIHGHFYQPPREDPFTDVLPLEFGAAPFANFNEKITTECYQPNADAGNFEAISFDLGPTLATWLAEKFPLVYRRILESDGVHLRRYGVGNALAQAYNHTILPLATSRDKRTQILWGLTDFQYRFKREAHGMWLAETAVDLECLEILAQHGITYTILAPWQAHQPVDSNEPYLLSLPSGRHMTVFFYNGPLSGGVSFDAALTDDAGTFVEQSLAVHVRKERLSKENPQLLMIATDGELYGHHKSWRDRFLTYLLRHSAPEHGFEVCTPERYMGLNPAVRPVELRVPSAWSCTHGVARWGLGCTCTEGISTWKWPLREALHNVYVAGSTLFERYTAQALDDPWAARDGYLALHNGWESAESFWARYGKHGATPAPPLALRTLQLLQAQYYFQYSFTSCGFFFEDLDRIEPRNNIAFARKAISLTWQALEKDLQQAFVCDLAKAQSWRTDLTGADLYRQLPPVPFGLLPFLRG